MGLKDKIKGALHPDREREESSMDNQYDSKYDNKYDSRHGTTGTEGRDYDATHQDTKYGTKYDTGRTNADTTAEYGYGHRKTDSGVDFGNQPYTKDDDFSRTNPSTSLNNTTNTTTSATSNTQPEYWGNMGQGRNSPPRKTDTLDSSYNTDDRSRLHKDLPLRPDQQTAAANSRFDDTRYDTRGNTSTTGASGGTYNTVAGAGSPEYDSRHRDRDMGRDNRAAMGTAGVAGAGAGIAANQAFDRRDDRYNDVNQPQQYQQGGGVPQSSMLDPYQTGPGSNTRAGPHDSNLANKMDPRVDSDRDGSNNNRLPGNNLNQNRFGATSGAAAGAAGLSSGMGPDHFGPGHEGAKVVHTCVGCGLDNDISQYFRKDATYRMG